MAIKQQVMALNPARKGNMGRLNSSQPLYVYDTLIAQPWLKGVIAQIRGEKAIPGVDAGDEKAVKKAREGLKRQLPIRAIHYSKFRNNHRSSEDAVPESFLFQTTIDVDDVEYVDAALEKARELNCSNTIWKGKLLHLDYSARKKLHIDIRMPMGMTIEETQKAYCEAAGIPYDKSCITPERIIFITDKDSEIYRSKEWYGVLPDEEIQARREAFLKRGLTIDGKGTARYSLLAGDCKSPERLSGDFQGQVPNCKSPERLAGDFQGQIPSDSNHKVQSSNLKVQSNADVQDNRFQGIDSHSAVPSGAAIQPAADYSSGIRGGSGSNSAEYGRPDYESRPGYGNAPAYDDNRGYGNSYGDEPRPARPAESSRKSTPRDDRDKNSGLDWPYFLRSKKKNN